MQNVIKFQAPFERLKLYNNPAISLQKAIILQAIIDATDLSKSKNKKNAIDWLYNNSPELTKICENTDLELDFVRKITNLISKIHKHKQGKIRDSIKKYCK